MTLPPGPKLPGTLQLARWIARPLPFLEECAARYGDIFTLRLSRAGTAVMVTTPELVKQVLTADPDVLRAGEGNQLLEPFLGKHSVLTLDGAEHLRQRRLLLPAFHGERMQTYARVMREITEASLARWPVGEPFALHPRMQEITLEVILRTVFGIDEAARLDALRAQIVAFLDATSHPISLVPALLHIDLFQTAPWLKRSRMKHALDVAIYEEIARRRKRGGGGTDVLSMMLEARDDRGDAMTDVEVRDELLTLLVAGHETTATALAWTFERLLAEPATLAVLRDDLAAGRDAYVDAVIKESLRLRPIVPLVARLAKRPFELGGYTVPPDVRVMPNVYLLHRRADVYPEPARFRPERWLGVKPDPYGWIPFGGGIRRCLGMAFALFEMRVVLETVIQRVRLRAAGGPSRIARRAITLAPADGTRVLVEAA